MQPLDALQRPSVRASVAKVLLSLGGVSVGATVRAAVIRRAKIIRLGGTACGGGSGSR
jgi:hypothetical protein